MLITPLSMAVPVNANNSVLEGVTSSGDPLMAFPLNSGEVIYTPVLTYEGVSVFDSSVFMCIVYSTSWIRVYIFPDNEFNSSWIDSDGKLWLDFKSGYTDKYISSIYSFTNGTWGSWSTSYTSKFSFTLIDNNFWFLNAPSGASLPSGGPPDITLFVLSSGGPGILSVFTGVGSWLSGAVQNISTMFWIAESGMTVLGYLAVASLAVAVILLIFYLIAGWLKFH